MEKIGNRTEIVDFITTTLNLNTETAEKYMQFLEKTSQIEIRDDELLSVNSSVIILQYKRFFYTENQIWNNVRSVLSDNLSKNVIKH